MQRQRFLEAFRELLSHWHSYQAAPRHPEQVIELASARMALDDARRNVAEARGAWEPSPYGSNRRIKRTSVSDDDLSRLRVQQFPS